MCETCVTAKTKTRSKKSSTYVVRASRPSLRSRWKRLKAQEPRRGLARRSRAASAPVCRPRLEPSLAPCVDIEDTLSVQPPDVSYARSGDVAIAYQVVGTGPPDIVLVRGIAGDLLSTWEQPLLVRHVKGLAESGRVLMLDRRGTGLSDRVREVQALETTI